MGSKKPIIITIVLFLVVGMGSFVFAGNEGTDIDPSKKVDVDHSSNNNGGTTNNSGENNFTNNGDVSDDNVISDPSDNTDNDINLDNNITNSGNNSSNNSGNSSSTNTSRPNGGSNSSNGSSSISGGNSGNSGNNSETNTGSGSSEGNTPVTPSDNVAPILSVATSNNGRLTNQNVIVTITANEEIKEVSGWMLASDKKTLTKEFSSNTSGEVVVYDLAGNESKITYVVTNIDKDKPILSVNYSSLSPTNQNVVITVKTNEEVKEVSGWTLASDKKTLTKEVSANEKGILKVEDLANNLSDIEYSVLNIDKEAPILSVDYSITKLTNQNVTVTIKSNEVLKSVDGWILASDGLSISKELTQNDKGVVSVSDLAENAETIEYEVSNIDKIAPVIKKVTTSNNNGYKVTFKDIVVTIETDKELQELDDWTLSNDKKSLSKIFRENIKDAVDIKDEAGNVVNVPFEVRNYDPNSPEVTTSFKDGKVEVKIEYKEELPDVPGWTKSDDGLTLTKEFDVNEDGTVIITMPDGTVKNIEYKAAPEVSITASNMNEDGSFEKTNKPVIVTITSNKELLELEGWELSENKLVLTKEISKATTIKANVIDVEGNSTYVSLKVKNIDTTLPSIWNAVVKQIDDRLVLTINITETVKPLDGWSGSTSMFYKDVLDGEKIVVMLEDNYGNINYQYVNVEMIDGKPTVSYGDYSITKMFKSLFNW